MEQLISNRAEIHPDAKIGKNVTIEAFAKIDKDVVIGDGTWIGSNAIIYPGARIGKDCKIFPGAVISAQPQDLKFKGEYTTVEIGDRTTVREYVTINRGTAARGVTSVGNDTLLMAYSHLGHDVSVGNHCVISNSVQLAGEVVLEDWVVIGGMSAVHQFCRVGAHAMVSGMSGVLSDVPPYSKVFGVPVAYMGINVVGLKRRGFSKQQIDNIHEIYRVIYQQGRNISQALEYIQTYLDPNPEMGNIISFIKSSKRGIVKSVFRQTASVES
ncbi:acyl-ACP--UDP-N-acetylglucosamine O-acyltransferase [Thermophagus xiamenensis]|jgi:UDP-N-acetylglucosamine acyltransferase|uniref:Acyl-[acyl-carrier-protein]--UDP-N-acetylglucosamine O-acyltransferase n=1 Tax=Thermophagus xiamenensis TaxID=385682 RepID=A0A1I1UGM4_9BACT|nr:acyl-ACP--UDP-N-acetylglucosamine O-acyltransferase [Thermophagus xiamenensis]SFD69854.1 acyl-[acyl-carrier-protein]--UDP-N-acetylglucosamine O-acyltransferase [Thermophagus xiamenensis]